MEISRQNVRLLGRDGLQEVPERFDLEGYIKMRAERSRKRKQEIADQYGDNPPARIFNPLFVFASIMVFTRILEKHPEAYASLLEKLKNPDVSLPEEHAVQIMKFGSTLQKLDDGTYVVDQLGRAIFRDAEVEWADRGGFDAFIKASLEKDKEDRQGD